MSVFILLIGSLSALADDKKPGTTEVRVESAPTTRDETSSKRMMKIQSDENDELRRQQLLEELRRLYKSNFL